MKDAGFYHENEKEMKQLAITKELVNFNDNHNVIMNPNLRYLGL